LHPFRGLKRQLGFAFRSQARHSSWPNRVCVERHEGALFYGLVLHLLLFPTPPRGDAVTLGYKVQTEP